jgi:ubiquinone biosynthesis protein
MDEQVGWVGLLEQLKKEGPRYVHLLPQLPRLIHAALQPPPPTQQRALEALLAEQRRTNRLLAALLIAAIVFVAGLAALQFFGPLRIH